MVDVHEARDYPVVLGDSLKNSSSQSQYLQFRYNWVPDSGFDGASGVLKKPTNDFSLSYDLEGNEYEYTGWDTQDDNDEDSSDFALIYDEAGKNFRLERLAASIDLNLKSASNLFSADIRKHRQITKQRSAEASTEHNDQQKGSDRGDGEADPLNPFDYRHFLVEAQQELDKAPATESKAPLPGARTPLSGFTSPAPGATQFRATTPEFKSATTVPQKRKAVTAKRKAAAAPRRQQPQKSAAPARGKVLSKDRITDSDEDIDLDDAPPPRRSSPSTSKPKKAAARSPEIQIDNASEARSDAESDGGLEIDNGSPPPTSKAKRHINVEAFRSGTSTPLLEHSTNRNRGKSHLDEMMIDDADDDQDVEPLNLERDSPAAPNSRRTMRSISPPRHARQSTMDEDDVDLEAEFAKELEAEDDEMVGLGIDHGNGGGGGGGKDDESEISEEE